MSRKRRIFDIDMPDEVPEAAPAPAPAPEAKSAEAARRGPMAAAITENAEALRHRRTAAEAIRAENDALAHEYVALRQAGHVVQEVPLDDVHCHLLTRDRLPGEDAELDELVISIREVGLSNPIRVIPRPGGDGYELVQGFRRLSAYRKLRGETPSADKQEGVLSADNGADGQGAWDRIPALILPGAPDIAGLYRRMVDENVIRKDLSFAEMAHAATVYAADPATEVTDVSDAVTALFQSAPRSKRTYIRHFATLLERIGGLLLYPSEIPRALGLTLFHQINERPELVDVIRGELEGWDTRSVKDELDVLRRVAGNVAEDDDQPEPIPEPKKAKPTGQGGRTKTTFHIQSRAGQVKCTAGPGRLEIQVSRDFSTIDRARLERAIASLIDGLG